MLKFGDKVISNLYFGDKRISKAYMGSKLVYKEREPIFLDYIITDGNSWIDTTYYPDDTKSIVEYDFEVHTKPSGTYNGLFGSRESTDRYVYNVFCKSNLELRLDYGVYNETSYTTSLNTKYTIKAGMGEIYINDELVKSYNVTMGLTPYSIYLGNFNQVNSTYETGTPQNIYGFRAYEEGVLTKDLRPCIHPNGTVCMYDMVAKKYHYNQGTGNLIAGPRLLDYIKFDGNSWIDTGITELGGTWTITASADDSTQLRFLIGNGGQAGQYYGALANGKWGLGTASKEYYFENARTSKMTAEVIFEESQATATVDGVTIVRPGTRINDNFLLCGYQSSASNYLFKGDVYHCSYVDITGNLILDLYPAIDPSGVVCMFDKVTHTYYYNQGEGEIKAGGRFVTSILFDGASVIDTGLPHQTCVIECDIRFEETGTRQLMGFGTGSGQYWGAGATGIFDYMSDTNALDRTLVVIDFNAEQINYTIYADGKSRTSASGNTLSSHTYRIGAGPTGVSSNSYWCTCEVWGNKFTNADGEVIQDLRPYVDENGTPCLYDLVTNVKFYNKGTGTLSYT